MVARVLDSAEEVRGRVGRDEIMSKIRKRSLDSNVVGLMHDWGRLG
jgi:hypothetical protein